MQSKKQKRPLLSTRNVVIFEGPEPNRSHWTIDIVDSLIIGKDGVTKAVKVWTGKSTLERAMQQLYSLELHCDSKSQDQIKVIDEIKSKRKQTPRYAAAVAQIRMQDQAQDDSLEAQFWHIVFDTTRIKQGECEVKVNENENNDVNNSRMK